MKTRTALASTVLPLMLATGAAAQQPPMASGERKGHLVLVDAIAMAGAIGVVLGIQETDDAVVLRGRNRRQVVPHASILRIDKRGDPLWDPPLASAGFGALVGFGSAYGCTREDPVTTRLPRDRMTLWGASVVGVMGLVLDLLHKGRTTMFHPAGDADPPAVGLTPFVSPRGGGVSVSWRF